MEKGPKVKPDDGKKVEFKRCEPCGMTFMGFQDSCPQCGNTNLDTPIEANKPPDYSLTGGLYDI